MFMIALYQFKMTAALTISESSSSATLNCILINICPGRITLICMGVHL